MVQNVISSKNGSKTSKKHAIFCLKATNEIMAIARKNMVRNPLMSLEYPLMAKQTLENFSQKHLLAPIQVNLLVWAKLVTTGFSHKGFRSDLNDEREALFYVK